ncbi:MAG: hypothetical protein IPL79_07510 [Myxococcales bacterium]|nr:hypothetical protein [Myxococcales bacterium]
MSTFVERSYACVRCAAPFTARVAIALNVTRHPHVRDDILAGTFQEATCAACGASMPLTTKLTYLDLARGQLFILDPYLDMSEQAIEADFQGAMQAALPHMRALVGGLARRGDVARRAAHAILQAG